MLMSLNVGGASQSRCRKVRRKGHAAHDNACHGAIALSDHERHVARACASGAVSVMAPLLLTSAACRPAYTIHRLMFAVSEPF